MINLNYSNKINVDSFNDFTPAPATETNLPSIPFFSEVSGKEDFYGARDFTAQQTSSNAFVDGLSGVIQEGLDGPVESLPMLDELFYGLEHENITLFLNQLYEESNKIGICHGFALMGMEAILSGTFPAFTARIERLIRLVLSTPKKTYAERIEIIREKEDFDLLAFLEGVEIAADGDKYPFLFEEENRPPTPLSLNFVSSVFSLIASRSFEAKGKLRKVGHSTGVYSVDDLLTYFQSFASAVKKGNFEPVNPIAFRIVSYNHAIAIGYDPVSGLWTFVDANSPFPAEECSDEVIANKVYQAYGWFEGETVCLNMQMYILDQQNSEEEQGWETVINRWKNDIFFQQLHVTESKTRRQQFYWFRLSVINGDFESIDRFIQSGFVSRILDEDGSTSLTHAAKIGHTEIVKLLLEAGADVDQPDKYDWTPLMQAAYYGFSEILELLLAAGADVHRSNNEGFTSLMLAASRGDAEIVKILLEAGSDVHRSNNEGSTSLMLAAVGGYAEIVELLVAAGADVHQLNHNGRSALVHAAWGGHAETVKFLLGVGADVHQSDHYGWTPLLYLAWFGGSSEVVKELLLAGADVQYQDYRGRTALGLAAEQGHLAALTALIEAGAPLDQKNQKGWTALMTAAYFGHTDVLDLLIRSGAGIEEENGNGSTALMAAACAGHPECVKALLAAGAKVDKQNHEGSTALSFALLYEHPEVVTILEEAQNIPGETEFVTVPEVKKETFLESLYSLWNRFFGVLAQ